MMLKTRNDIVREAIKIQKYQASVQRRLTRRLNTLLKNYQAQVQVFINRRGIVSDSDKFDVVSAIRIADDLKRILAEAGADDLIADYIESFEPLAERALSYFSGLGEAPNMAGVSREALTGFVRYSEGYLRETMEMRFVKPIADSVFSVTYGGMSRMDAIDNIMERFDDLTPNAAALMIDDSLQQFQRAVTVEKADALDLEIYVYAGPLDEITSDQCEHLLTLNDHGMEGALYKDEISQDLHPDLTGNPLIAGGHPRCRHKYYPISLDFAVSNGFKPRKGGE